MKTALALGGGGAKGSYQLGVITALKELNINFDIITGTSIGSLNGALLTCGDMEICENLWSTITKEQVLKPIDTEISLSKLQKIIQKTPQETLTTEIDYPLKKLILKYLDEEKVRNSHIDFGLVCVNFPSMKPVEIKISDIKQGSLCDYLLASSAIYPAFPMVKIEEKLHIDGAFFDNLPINLAFNMGADQVIAVDLFSNPTHSHYQNSPLVRYIKPNFDLSPMLEFDLDLLNRNRSLGYLDTLKSFEKLSGYKFSFKRDNDFESPVFAKNIASFESLIPSKRVLAKKIIAYPLSSCLKEHTLCKLSLHDFSIRGLEIILEKLDYDPTVTYEINDINRELSSVFSNKTEFKSTDILKVLSKKSKSSKLIIGAIYHKLLDTKELFDELFWLSTIMPKEVVSALYLYSIHR